MSLCHQEVDHGRSCIGGIVLQDKQYDGPNWLDHAPKKALQRHGAWLESGDIYPHLGEGFLKQNVCRAAVADKDPLNGEVGDWHIHHQVVMCG